MGRAVTWVLGALAAAAAGAFAPAFASEANLTVITKGAPSQLYGGTLDLPPTRGFSFVTISDKPPSHIGPHKPCNALANRRGGGTSRSVCAHYAERSYSEAQTQTQAQAQT